MPVLEQQVAVRLPSSGRLRRKRLFDMVCAALGLLILSPVLLVCALLVGLTSPGGVAVPSGAHREGRRTLYHLQIPLHAKGHAGLKISTSAIPALLQWEGCCVRQSLMNCPSSGMF